SNRECGEDKEPPPAGPNQQQSAKQNRIRKPERRRDLIAEGHAVPVGEIERHPEQTEPENILESRPENDPLQIGSQNVLLAPQILAYGVHRGIEHSPLLPRRLKAIDNYLLQNTRFSQPTCVWGRGQA